MTEAYPARNNESHFHLTLTVYRYTVMLDESNHLLTEDLEVLSRLFGYSLI